MVGRRVGRFLVLSKLGQGGMATVWKARDELLGREVALKVLDEKLGDSPKVRRRFLHEAQTVASLDHPGAVAVYDSGESDGNVFIAMRLVDGETLSELLGRRLLPIAEAVRIVAAVADVLAHAHQRGVVHRDVTSRNIMVGNDGRVFVLDFGLALANWESRVTSTGTTLGTVPYMAPEVLLGKDADPRTDLYSLGVVLYEALTGAYPHRGDPPAATVFAALHSEPIPPRERRPEITEALERIALKAIAREPEARYQSAEALGADLRCLAPADEKAPQRPALPQGGQRDMPWHTRPYPLYLSILPFRLAATTEQADVLEALRARLPETIGCALAKHPGVRVVSSPAQDQVPEDADLRILAERLGANALLRGRLERAGSQLRVSYAVIDPWRETHLAGDVVDASALQPFEVEDRLVASVVASLGLKEAPGGPAPASKPPDPAADERFAQALGYLRRYDNEASLDGAIRLLEQLIASEGNVAAYHATLALAYLHKMERTKQRVWEGRAASACARAVEIDPEDPEVHIAIGRLRSAAGQYDDARREFASALDKKPDSVEAKVGSVLACLGAGDSAGALREAVGAAARHADDWRVHSVLGWVHFTSGCYEQALGPWETVIRLTPDNALGHLNLGNALYHLDRFDEAVESYRRSLTAHPYHRAFTSLGTALYHLGRNEECLAAFRKATELTPTDPVAWGNLGNACHWIDGHEREAVGALDHAIALMREQLDRNPSFADGWARMAGWLANRGLSQEAEAAIRRALELAPHDPHCMVHAGHVFFQLGNRRECLHWIREAVRAGYGTKSLLKSRELAPLRQDPEFIRLMEVRS